MKFKMYLLDSKGNSPCLGLDEVLEGTKEEVTSDYASFLVSNEGFEFEDENIVIRDGETYEIQTVPVETVKLYDGAGVEVFVDGDMVVIADEQTHEELSDTAENRGKLIARAKELENEWENGR